MSYESWRISYQNSEQAARAAYSECMRLQESREREGDRLDWLMVKLQGNVTRELVGEMSDTLDPKEWRNRIDEAMKTPNSEVNGAL